MCYEFLDNLVLKTRQDGQVVFYHYYGVPGHRLCDSQWVEEDNCLWCSEPYLKRFGSNTLYCDDTCRKAHTEWKKDKREKIEKLKNRYKTHRGRKGYKWSEESKECLRKAMSTPEYKEKMVDIIQRYGLKLNVGKIQKNGELNVYLY
jgi:hypothetical protein